MTNKENVDIIIEYRNLIITALLAAKEAGEVILSIYGSDFNVEFKNDRSPLTMADRCSQEIITHHLRNPQMSIDGHQFPILSEEGKDISYEERKNWEYFWLIDPLDGTKEFIKRNGEFTVNIALIYKDSPVLGVIYAPVTDIYYFAVEGLGAYKLRGNEIVKEMKSIQDGDKIIKGNKTEKATSFRNGRKMTELLKVILEYSNRLSTNLNSTEPVTHLTVVGSRSHATENLDDFVARMKQKHGQVNFISAGSSLKFCLIADGRADIYPRFGPTMEWDTASGQIIVTESGGKVLNMETHTSLRYNKKSLLNPWFLVTNKSLDEEVLKT